MTKREAKILAIETFANSAEILIESIQVNNLDELDKINVAFDELADELLKRANRLKNKTVKRK